LGSGYAGARLGGTRFAKSYFMDVLEFTGEDNNYYSDSTIQAFMEWLYGYSTTPFRLCYTFGDASPRSNSHKTGPGQYRVHRFSAAAEKYAAWNNDGRAAPGRLLYYIFMTEPFPQPQRAPSRIFPDGGAWFIEAGDSNSDLAGALWNCRSEVWHSHKDVSAIHLAAYGEHVLRNSGYCGAGMGALGFSWDYIHNYAESSNTALINGADHTAKIGAGITEGFTAPCFDYASSDSGNALSGGHHQRNLVFIHPQDRVNGYWILFDEVYADRRGRWGSPVNVVLHPNSNDCSIISADTEYKWKIGPYTYSGHDVYLSIFLGTAPVSMSVKDGLLASFSDESFVGQYLYSTYDTDRNGNRNIVTILFPHDDTHAKAAMTRISASGYTGASVALSHSAEDIALESTGARVVTYNNVSFIGLATWYRLEDGLLTSYFVRKGQSLDDGFMPRVGFEALNDVSIYLDGTAGRIISPETLVTFYYPGIVGVSLDGGSPLLKIRSGTDWVQVIVPSGTHKIEFNTRPSLPSNSVEGFETGDFSKFTWEHDGDSRWAINSAEKNSGNYSAQAGLISDDQYTTLEITLNCISGDISFYRKVSCESGYDYLKFYIDDRKKGEWSGDQDWRQVSFPVTAGTRNFKWTYAKDSSAYEGSDTAWIDDIVFPIPW